MGIHIGKVEKIPNLPGDFFGFWGLLAPPRTHSVDTWLFKWRESYFMGLWRLIPTSLAFGNVIPPKKYPKTTGFGVGPPRGTCPESPGNCSVLVPWDPPSNPRKHRKGRRGGEWDQAFFGGEFYTPLKAQGNEDGLGVWFINIQIYDRGSQMSQKKRDARIFKMRFIIFSWTIWDQLDGQVAILHWA